MGLPDASDCHTATPIGGWQWQSCHGGSGSGWQSIANTLLDAPFYCHSVLAVVGSSATRSELLPRPFGSALRHTTVPSPVTKEPPV